MPLPTHVIAYAGHRSDERPRRFELDGVEYRIYRIYAWEREWRTPDARCFLVRAEGQAIHLSCNEQSGQWTLQSELDGVELVARPTIELVSVGPEAIREAVSRIAGCERCRGDDAFQPFDWILADALVRHGAFEFVLTETARCPNCKAEISEKSLVETKRRIEVESPIAVVKSQVNDVSWRDVGPPSLGKIGLAYTRILYKEPFECFNPRRQLLSRKARSRGEACQS
jgi:hypothetical protein